jgi:lipoprotein signal peptidase
MNNITEMLVTIAMGIIGVAILAVIVSKNSNTAGVIQASASGFGNTLDVAISPVTGATVAPNLAYPGGGGIGSITGGFTPYSGMMM